MEAVEKLGKVEEILPILFKLDKDKLYDISIKEHKEKRSLSANAYCWVLISKIAAKTKTTKEEVYLEMLKRYGVGTTFEISSNVTLDNFFKYYEVLAERKNKKVVRSYVGSSEYNSQEMFELIDGIIYEAKAIGIETMTPDELARLDYE